MSNTKAWEPSRLTGRRGEIAIWSLHYPPEPTGNAPYAGRLAAGLAASGHRVTAYVGFPHYPEWKVYPGYHGLSASENKDGVEIRRLRHYVPNPPRGIRRLISEVSFGLRLLTAHWGSPEVVLALSPPLFSVAIAAVRLRLTPNRPRFIIWVQDIYSLGIAETGQGGAFIQKITRWIEKHTLAAADQIVVAHKRYADFIIESLGITATEVEVLRNWTHLPPSPSVEPRDARSILGWPSDVTIAVHAGNMGVKQGLENLVGAARLADMTGAPVRFILIGDGSERIRIENSARGVTRLEFIDPLPDREYRLALAAADVLLVNEKPGVSAMAAPSKLTSYFDVGRPIVAAVDPNGITASEISFAKAGVVVPAGDPERLLAAVLRIAAEPDLASHFGRNGRIHRENYLGEEGALRKWEGTVARVFRQRKDHIGRAPRR